MIFQLAMALDDDDDSDDDSVVDVLTLAAVEPLQRKFMQDVGSEKLSIARLQREAAAHGRNHDDMSITVYTTFGFRLEWLPAVVAVLDVPDEVTLDGNHVCSGEEAVLLLLYRLRCTGPVCCYPTAIHCQERPHRRFLLIGFCLIALPITHHGSWA